MATKKVIPTFSAKEMKALAAELGVPVKEGKVTAVRDRFFVTIGKKKTAIPVGEIIDQAQIKSLVGQPVSAIVVNRNIVAITGLGWKPPIIVCYIPVPDFIKGIREELRTAVLKGMVERQIITPNLQERLMAGK